MRRAAYFLCYFVIGAASGAWAASFDYAPDVVQRTVKQHRSHCQSIGERPTRLEFWFGPDGEVRGAAGDCVK